MLSSLRKSKYHARSNVRHNLSQRVAETLMVGNNISVTVFGVKERKKKEVDARKELQRAEKQSSSRTIKNRLIPLTYCGWN